MNYTKLLLKCGVLILVAMTVINFSILIKKDYDCKDFNTYEEAQKVFLRYDTDKYDLDRNQNNVPCELLLSN